MYKNILFDGFKQFLGINSFWLKSPRHYKYGSTTILAGKLFLSVQCTLLKKNQKTEDGSFFIHTIANQSNIYTGLCMLRYCIQEAIFLRLPASVLRQ